MDGPYYSLEVTGIEFTCVAPRQGIWERHCAAIEPSVRNIDNLLLGEQNSTTGTRAAHRPTDVDGLVSQARAVADTFPGSRLAGWTSDFTKAFKQVPSDPSQVPYVIIAQWDPFASAIAFFICYCQVFGSRSAPLNFSRFPAWCCQVLGRAWAIPMTHCVDDMITVERLATAESSREAWLTFAELCGWLVAMDKSPLPDVKFAAIGIIMDLSRFPHCQL